MGSDVGEDDAGTEEKDDDDANDEEDDDDGEDDNDEREEEEEDALVELEEQEETRGRAICEPECGSFCNDRRSTSWRSDLFFFRSLAMEVARLDERVGVSFGLGGSARLGKESVSSDRGDVSLVSPMDLVRLLLSFDEEPFIKNDSLLWLFFSRPLGVPGEPVEEDGLEGEHSMREIGEAFSTEPLSAEVHSIEEPSPPGWSVILAFGFEKKKDRDKKRSRRKETKKKKKKRKENERKKTNGKSNLRRQPKKL